MIITYTKEGKRILHPSGVNQLLTLTDLRTLWEKAKVTEKTVEQAAERKHDDVTRIEALQ